MANSRSAAKRNRQNHTVRERNRAAKSAVRTSIKSFTAAVKSSDKGAAEQKFQDMVKLIDTAARKGLYHKNTAARKISRMHKLLNTLSA